jgi:hypothetical protein
VKGALGVTVVSLATLAATPALAQPPPVEPAADADADADAAPAALAGADGPLIALATRPADDPGGLRACSFTLPICVHAPRGGTPGVVLGALASAESAWRLLEGALALPRPDVDVQTGALDVYLVDHVDGLATAILERRDVRSAFDRASAFVTLDASARGCVRDAAMGRALARASLWRAAPATDEGTAQAETSYLARLMVPCAMSLVDGVDRFQETPETAIVDASAGLERARGAGLFYWWLDYSFGREPGGIVRALWALAPTRTPAGASRWQGKPNVVDVLRASFKNALLSGSTVDDLWVDFGVGRAFAGDADDGAHLPESRGLGASGRVHAQWEIGWPDRPRSLASGTGVAPTGTSYVIVSRSGAPAGARLRVEVAWEEHARMRWTAVKLDASGRELAQIGVPGPDRGTAAQITLVDLDATARVLLVGTNVGDPFHPFDPSAGVWEPHGWTLTVAGE